MNDALSTVLQRARVEAAFFSRALGTAPWGVETRGAATGIFHVVVRGQATLRADGRSVTVNAGELVVLPGGIPHVLADPPTAAATWIGALPRVDAPLPTVVAGCGQPVGASAGEPVGEPIGEPIGEPVGEPETEILCGTLRFGPLGQELLLAHLPPVLHARGPALGAWVTVLAGELRAHPPGADAVASCLGQLLFLLALREWLDASQTPGWLAGLTHPDIGKALAMVQAAPAEDWSVDRLARRCALSRSVFCERFTAVVGEPPAAWVTRWRMIVARELLEDPDRGIAEVAAAVGYASEAAFHRAFKRAVGQPPARWRRGPDEPGPRGSGSDR